MGVAGADSAGGDVQGLKGSRGALAGVSQMAGGTLVAALPSLGRGLARHPPSAAEGPALFTRLCPRTPPCCLPPQAVGEGFCRAPGPPAAPQPRPCFITTPHEIR